MDSLTILCTDSCCVYNNGNGYYGVCQHPSVKDAGPYYGIDRIYRSSCNLKEYKERGNSDETERLGEASD